MLASQRYITPGNIMSESSNLWLIGGIILAATAVILAAPIYCLCEDWRLRREQHSLAVRRMEECSLDFRVMRRVVDGEQGE